MSSAADTADTGNRRRLAKWLKLGGLAVLGLSTVSIPVTIAIASSATGASDVPTIAPIAQTKQRRTPAKALAGLHCVAKRGYYALTFDEGPSAGTTPRIVAALSRAKAVATFFDVGEDAVAHQDLVELQRSVGQVANHSYSHPHLSQLSDARREQELTATARALDFPNVFFRPPYGEADPQTDAAVRRTGLTSVYWTVDTRDVRAPTEAIVKRALAVKPGGIILVHDGVEHTVRAIPGITEGLRKRGMCPGFLATTHRSVRGANGIPFHVTAVKP
jgi:peptidoglycan/xylan/chitin deacetylase (PgdA/CDA1 family)